LPAISKEARFLTAVEKGIAAAERGEFIEEEEMDARLQAMLSPDAHPLDGTSRRRFTGHQRSSAANYPQFAVPTVRMIYQRIRSLKISPDRGRPGHRSGTRELALTPLPYIVVYAVKAEAVEILHIHHGAQDWR
jgi:plasmid stabilization system protein ParE